MPYRLGQLAAQRRRRVGGAAAVAGALVRGTRYAYQNRQVAQDVARAARRGLDRLKANWKKKRTEYSKEGTMDSATATAPGNDWTISKRTVGRKKKPTLYNLKKMVEVGMSRSVFRFQGITNFDTNAGYFYLGNGQTTANEVLMPLHIYDLTTFPNTNDSQIVANTYYWNGLTSGATAQRSALQGQKEDGSTLGPGWTVENSSKYTSVVGATVYPNSRLMRHDWTDVRINCYGARKRTTRFEIIFFRCKDVLAHPFVASTSNAAYNELIEYLQRPCVYSNLQTYSKNPSRKIQIVKRMIYWIPAGQTTDVDTSVGKIKEARIFMRHDRVYNLDWRHEGVSGTLPHNQDDGIDYLSDTAHHNNPWHGSRLLMCIRAFAPERLAGKAAGGYQPPVTATVDPSYDIVIRNCISTPA